MKISLNKDIISDIFKSNMIKNLECRDIADKPTQNLVRKIKGFDAWESFDDVHMSTIVNIQKNLIETAINLQKEIDNLKESK